MGSQITSQKSSLASSTAQFLRFDEQPRKWNAFVRAHPKGTVFHLSEMLSAFTATEKHEVVASAALDSDGEIVALLPSVRISTLGGVAGWLSSRAVCFAEPICEPTSVGQAALQRLIERHDQQLKRRTLFAEVRNIDAAAEERLPLEACGYEYTDYLNYLVDTGPDVDRLWQKLGKSARNTIRRSQRRGISIERADSHAGIDRMYPLVQLSYERSAVPLADIGLFHEALSRLPESTVQVRIARYQEQDIAAGIALVYGNRFYAWYGGSERPKKVSPFDCLTWDEIEWCSQNEIDFYDFGGAGWPNEDYGPRAFKAKFGGDLVSLGRYRRTYQKGTLWFAKTAFKTLRKIKQCQPFGR